MKRFLTFLFALSVMTDHCYAISISVTKFNDSFDGECNADCSLREAIQLANETPGEDQIALNAGTYIVDIPAEFSWPEIIDEDDNKNGDLDLTDDVVILGAASGGTVIDAGNDDRVLENITGSSALYHLTLTHGKTSSSGGGIENHGALTLFYCSVSHNSARVSGGAIKNNGTLTIIGSNIFGNGVHGGHDVLPAEGGGIYNKGTLLARNSVIQMNEAISNRDVNMGGGIFNEGSVDIRRSLFANNRLHNDEHRAYNGNGTALLNAVPSQPGAASGQGKVTLFNTTFSGNQSSQFNVGVGAAVANGDDAYDYPNKIFLRNVTIANNSGLGLFTLSRISLQNSLIIGNYSPLNSSPNNCRIDDYVFNSVKNIIGSSQDTSCRINYLTLPDADIFTQLIAPLADNGGPTLTHALRNNSIAIDAGDACASEDQRGYAAPVDGNSDGVATCDLGAFEFHPAN